MTAREIFFIQDENIAEENEHRDNGPSYYCDKNGVLYKVDLIVSSKKELADYVGMGAKIIGSFQEIGSLIFFGCDEPGVTRREEGEGINLQLRSKRYSEEERKAVAATYQQFFGKPLPPYDSSPKRELLATQCITNIPQ